jgi:hypothetical protein
MTRLVSACLAVAAVLAVSASAAEPLSTVTLTSLTVKRAAVHDGFAGTVSLRFRLCLSVGPRAALITRETRKVAGVTKAQATSLDPLGVDLTRVYPYDCANNYESSWIVPARLLVGGGTYSVNLRARDGYGRMSAPLLFSVRL